MSRLLVFPLLLIPVFALAMGAFMLIGRMQPPSDAVQWLHLTDCTIPCWNSITPRASSRGQVEDRMNTTFPDFQQFPSPNLPFLDWTLRDTARHGSTTIEFGLDDGVVSSVVIGTNFVSDQMPRLGDVLSLFGAPTCVNNVRGSLKSLLSYENPAHHVILQFTVDQPSLFTRVVVMSVGASYNLTCQKLLAISWQEYRNSHPLSL